MAFYYVDSVGGSDANPGTSAGAAKQTLAAGIGLLGPGDTLYVKAGTYTLTSGVTITAAQCGTTRAGATTIEGYVTTPGDTPDPASAPLITTAANSVVLLTYAAGTASAHLVLRSLKLTNTAATKAVGVLGTTGAGSAIGNITFDRVEIAGCSSGFSAANRVIIAYARKWVIRSSTGEGVLSAASVMVTGCVFEDCKFIDNGSNGFNVGANATSFGVWVRCVFSGNAGVGLIHAAQARTITHSLTGCTFEGNTGDGFQFTFTTGTITLQASDCVFYGNGGYGLNMNGSGGGSIAYAHAYGNAYGSNTSGASQGLTYESGAKSLSADPFTNAAAEDWSPNATPGAGALLRGAGNGGADIGAIQSTPSGGGSGGPPRVLTPNTWSLVG